MKPVFQISWLNRWLEWSWILFFISLPAGRPLTTYAVVLVALASLFSLRKNFKYELKNSIKIIWPLLFFYGFHLTGILYTDDFLFAFKDLSIKLPILLIPLLAIPAGFSESFRSKAATAFTLSCALINIFLLARAFYQYSTGVADAFFYDIYSAYIHPAYMALMNVIAISILLFANRNHALPEKWVSIGLMALLSFSIILMASKSGIISMLLVYTFFIFRTFFLKNKLITVFAFCGILLSSALFIWISPAKQRIMQSMEVILQSQNAMNQQEGTAGRLLAWKTAWQISRDYFPLGTGTGDIKNVTLEYYKKSDYQWPLYYHLNAHNQFLQSFAAIGTGGLISLFCILLIPVLRRKNGNVMPLLFSYLVFLNLLFESMLEVQNGVMLISAFYSLWIVMPVQSEKNV